MSSFTFGQVVDAAKAAGRGEDFDPGVYTVEILKIKDAVKKSDASTKLVFIEVQVSEGLDKGKRTSVTYSSKGLGFSLLKGDLNTLGITDDEMKSSDSEELTNRLAGTHASIEVKKSGDYTNYKFLGVESSPSVAAAAGSGLPWEN